MLPLLPKILKRQEAHSSLKFRTWLSKHPLWLSCSFEMKDTKGKNSLPFSAVEPQQLLYGQAIKSKKGVLIRVQGNNGEPDYVYLRNCPAYIVIKYPQGFEIVDIETFMLESKRSVRRSLTYGRAKALSVISII